MRRVRCSPALVLALVLTPALARAAWLPGGNRIGPDTGTSYRFVATASGPDRVVVAWIRDFTYGPHEVRAQAWTAEGDLVAGWPDDGTLVSGPAGHHGSLAICEDGAGGAFVAWVNHGSTESSVRLQHLSAAGSVAAGWAPGGLDLGVTHYAHVPAVAPDGAGGVLVGRLEFASFEDFRVIIRRFDASGAPVPGWPIGGLAIPDVADVALATDVQGRVFVGTTEWDRVAREPSGIRVRRLHGNAVPDPEWPQPGALLAEAQFPYVTRLFPDGTGGVFAEWRESIACPTGGCPPAPLGTGRVRGDGSPDGRWTPRYGWHSLAPDRTAGMLVGLVVGGRPGALRLDASGGAMPGWRPGGNPAMTEIVDPRSVLVTGDGQGGAFVVWTDGRTHDSRIYASRLDPSGRLAPGWPPTGSFVVTRPAWPTEIQLVSLREGVGLVVWADRAPEGSLYLTALRPGEPGPIAELGPVQVEVGFGIVGAVPNPVHGPIEATVELRNEGPARLDLVDATGRVRESRAYAFSSQARGVVRLNQARALPPGVYWLRLTQGARVASKKLVVLE